MSQKVVLVGRCNVGKSTTFNKLIKKRIAITHKLAGTTINSNEFTILWNTKQFTIIDTAGYNPNINDKLAYYILQQLYNTIKIADLLLFLVDGKVGLHMLDVQFANRLRIYNKNIILIINKIDTKQAEEKQYEFYNLGFNDIITISAEHNININYLLDKICTYINYQSIKNEVANVNTIQIAFVGKSNVGKSSIINAIANQTKSITHNKSYTTRDSIKVPICSYKHLKYLLIDTAGIPHENKIEVDIQYLSVLSTHCAIDNAYITILVVNALDGIGDTEIKIARLLFKKKKPIIIVINKWDLIDNKDKPKIIKNLLDQKHNKLKFIHWVDNVLFVSAQTKYNLYKILLKAQFLYEQSLNKISQENLDKCLENILATQLCITKGQTLIIKKCIQVSYLPPTFIFFVNNIELVHFSYKRFLENYLRKQLNLNCIPIICIFRKAL